MQQPIIWHGKQADGSPAGQMSTDEVRGMLKHLAQSASQGHTLLTWNGQGFDFDVLAEESGDLRPIFDSAGLYLSRWAEVTAAREWFGTTESIRQGTRTACPRIAPLDRVRPRRLAGLWRRPPWRPCESRIFLSPCVP